MTIEKTELFALGKHTLNAQDGVIIGLLFDQLTLDQILTLKESDYNKKNNQVTLNGETIVLSEETGELIKYALKNERYIGVGQYFLLDENAKTIVKPLAGQELTKEVLIERIDKIAMVEGYGDELTVDSIIQAGELHKESVA